MLISVIMAVSIIACNQTDKKSTITISGNISGIDNGTVTIRTETNLRDSLPPKAVLKEGMFTLTVESANEPTAQYLELKAGDDKFGTWIYVHNKNIIYEGEIADHEMYKSSKILKSTKVEGCVVNQHSAYYAGESNKIFEKYRTTKEMKTDELAVFRTKRQNKLEALKVNFIKKNSSEYFSAKLVHMLAKGGDVESIKKYISMLDPKMNNQYTKKTHDLLKKMETTYVKPSELIKASKVSYTVEKSFKGSEHTDVTYMGVLSNDNICTLTKDGEIHIINSLGERVNGFKPNLISVPTTICVDKSDNIYVLYPLQRDKEYKHKGKVHIRKVTYAYECVVYDSKGVQQNKFGLDGLKSATGSRVQANKLIVADFISAKIVIFNAKTGAKESDITGMRACCSILDFSVNDKNEVLVANLGAFRVEGYDLSGKKLISFGKRGKSLDDFHGCCNPVSVAYLSNGAIVTVEKDPTRIKIFSNEGAKQIENIEELVKGCSYIPMTVDSKDNLYLASPSQGLIKCVSNI